ncbi:MAG TPA: response regulator [Afifellaceae bacterium]|nr:response regulator [Afifellaceae bacterium]
MAFPVLLCVLVVDDDALLRDLISARLRADGHRVIEAASGDEAVAALLTGADPDVLVTDIAMPGSISGWCLGERFRSQFPNRPIIYSSSGASDPDRMQANSRFLQKPFHPDELLSLLEQVASLRPRPNSPPAGAQDTVR